jgi:diguanylate cyclase (GGDEF)-like protein/PAS domain S-box-containing protein
VVVGIQHEILGDYTMVTGLIIGVLIGALLGFWVCHKVKNKANPRIEYEANEKRLLHLVENTKDRLYYFETKPKWRYRYVWPPLANLMGEEFEKMIYENPHILLNRVHPEDYDTLIKKINGELDYDQPIIYRIQNMRGEYIWFEEFTTPVFHKGELVAIQGILRNIQEKIKLQQELEYRSTHDALTSLYNRHVFEDMLEKYDKDLDVSIGVILFDLDGLKMMNDTFGHKAGDTLIVETAKILNRFSSENIMISRIGGDEFAILVREKRTDVLALVDGITEEIKKYNENSIELTIRMSTGYVYSDQSLGNMRRLLTEADRNMYRNKNNRKTGSEQAG